VRRRGNHERAFERDGESQLVRPDAAKQCTYELLRGFDLRFGLVHEALALKLPLGTIVLASICAFLSCCESAGKWLSVITFRVACASGSCTPSDSLRWHCTASVRDVLLK